MSKMGPEIKILKIYLVFSCLSQCYCVSAQIVFQNANSSAKQDCKPFPPQPEPIDDHNIPLPIRLTSGITQMQPDLKKDFRGIFIMGNTGSGKSTLTEILTVNLSHLHATRTQITTGKMIIFDDENRISPPTTLSKTVIPEFLVNSETQTGFWDCPGFDDNRADKNIDIAAMYFLKTALDSRSQAKFLFTVLASSVKPGNDKTDFDNLAKHATQLIPNLDQVANSVGLVANKVSNFDEDSGQYQTDEMILSNILEFLKTYISDMKKQEVFYNKTDPIRLALEKRRKFAEIFYGDGNNETKVAFVRVPPVCGPLSEIPVMQYDKQMVTQLCEEKLSYSSVTPSYFHVTLNLETINMIIETTVPQTIQEIKENVVQSATNIWTFFRQNFNYRVKTGKYETPSKVLAVLSKNFEYSVGQMNSSVTSSFSDQLAELYKLVSTSLDPIQALLASIAEMEQQLNFFEFVSGHKTAIPDVSWLEPLQNMSTKFVQLYKFYNFCDALDIKLGGYTRQVTLSSVLKTKPNATQFLAENTLNFLIDNNVVRIPAEIEIIWQTNLCLADKQYLAKMVKDQIPNTKLVCTVSSQGRDYYHLQVFGRNIIFNDLVNSQDSWPLHCRGNTNVKEMSILASDKVFMDADIIEDCKTLQMSILAPTWEVIGTNHSINLGCSDQEHYKEDAAPGSNYGNSGHDGKDGKPGVPGGSLFGIYLRQENTTNLEIIADGGNGGDGQNGGIGHIGKPGEDATYAKFPHAYCIFPGDTCGLEVGYMYSNGTMGGSSCFIAVVYNKCWMTLRGEPGGCGGNGGRGGNGGAPGGPGYISLVSVSNISTTPEITSAINGKPGIPGKGGSPNNGGIEGKHVSCKHNVVEFLIFPAAPWWSDCYSVGGKYYSDSGVIGQDGQYNMTVVPAQRPNEQWKVITMYKKLFFDTKSSSNFIETMEQNSNIINLLTPLAFAEELEDVDTTFYRSGGNNKEKYVRFYNQFLQRLRQYAISVNITMANEGDKVALNYIYSTVMGKTIAMRQYGNMLKVINTTAYFDAILEEETTLDEKQREVAISEESATYQEKLNKRIDEAETFVQSVALPALETSQNMLKKANTDMIQEMNAYLQAAEENLEKQEQIKQQFENTLPLRYLLGGLKFLGAACAFFGPQGKIVGAAISATTAVAEPFLLKPGPDQPGTFDLPPGFGNQLEVQKRVWLQDKIEKLQRKINLTEEAVKLCVDDLSELAEKAKQTRLALQEIKTKFQESATVSNLLDGIKAIDKLTQELENMVRKMKDKSHKKVSKSKHDHSSGTLNAKKKKETVLNNLNVTMECVSAGINFLHGLVAEDSEIQRLNKLIEKAAQDVKLVEAKQTEMFTEFLPMLEEMKNDLQKESQNVQGLSLVALSVKRWNLQKMLQDMKRSLEDFTKGMKVQEEFQICIDKMDQAISLMMTLYEHVERYQESKELADYIANINSASDERAKIKDGELKRAIAKMDFDISANLFIEDYKRAIAAFKQWVFPFAANYLETNEELSEAEYGIVMKTAESNQTKALDEMVGFYKSKLRNLSVQLKKYYATTDKGDEDLILMHFIGGHVAVKPFFVWTNDKWQNSIADLLAGKQIHLKADPKLDLGTSKMLEGKAAVKYKSVQLTLRALEPNLQKDLEEDLKPFEMKMIHSGVSFYEIMGQKYVMTDANQTYRYCFEKEGEQGKEPVCQNEDQSKVKDRADYLMSPYTWWTFQMNDMTASGGVVFRDLVRKYRGKVNLELEGDGVYLDVDKKDVEFLRNLDLDKYYKRFDGEVDYLDRLQGYKAGKGSIGRINDQC